MTHIKRRHALWLAMLCSANILFAQDKNVSGDTTRRSQRWTHQRYNFIKANISSIILKNYSVQYERVLNRKISVALSFRVMPYGYLPFKSTILKAISSNDDKTRKTFENFKISDVAITPELRLYLGKKGYGRGFYIAPFYRFAKFTSNDVHVYYDNGSGGENDLPLMGSLTSNTAGILIGVQHSFGRFVLDLWLLGPHYGGVKANFSAISPVSLSASEQTDVHDQLKDINLPLATETVEVTSNSASYKLSGSWGGVRSGIVVGINF